MRLLKDLLQKVEILLPIKLMGSVNLDCMMTPIFPLYFLYLTWDLSRPAMKYTKAQDRMFFQLKIHFTSEENLSREKEALIHHETTFGH